MPVKRNPSEYGISLLEMLIAIGIFSIIVVLSRNQISQMLRFDKQSGDRFQLNQLSYDLQQEVDCQKVRTDCTSPRALDLYYKVKTGGNIRKFTADGKTQYRGWSVLARCDAKGSVEVRVAMRNMVDGKIGKGFAFDPLVKNDSDTNKRLKLNFRHPQAVVMPFGTLCPVPAPNQDVAIIPAGIDPVPSPTNCFSRSAQAAINCRANPPPCPPGKKLVGVVVDSFGGDNGVPAQSLFNKNVLSYCFQM